MKIIKNNKTYSNIFPMRIVCERVEDENGFAYGDIIDFCGSELEIEASDIKKHSWEKYPDYKGIDYGVKCPVCGMFIVVDKRYIPLYIQKNAPEISVN